MPRFSVIVPVFKVQGYLRACLDSVLSQSCTDVEVIAVDDCSPDDCGAILDEYAARDPRLRAVHLPENVGLGRARNAGVPYATGDYVLFLDSDDSYTPGLLAALAERLAVTDDPDILVFDHVRTYWWGRGGRSDSAALLEQAGTETFRVKDEPEYLNLFLVAWNKAFRRDFYLAHAFRYAPGLYEDAAVTYRAMVTADRIAGLDRIGVEYRQRRQGAITRTPGRKHFDIFRQYDGLFAELAGRPRLDWARPLLFERALDHMLFALARPERVTPEDREDFYRETAAFHRRHLPPDFTPPTGRRGTELRLIASAPYAAFHAVERMHQAGEKATRARRKVRRKAAARTEHAWYAAQLRRPLDPLLAVYGADHHRGMSGDPAAVHRRARELAPHIHGVWVVREDAAERLPPDVDRVVLGSRRYYEVMARATYWVNNVNWAGTLVKRPGTVHVHTHRGTPLKFMGADLRERPGARLGVDVRAMLRRADRWDLQLVAGRYAEEIWAGAYPVGARALRSGSPRNDVLVQGDPARAARTRARLGLSASDQVVLYAPTLREYRRGGYAERVDLERLTAALAPGTRLVVRLHPGLTGHFARSLVLRDLHRRGVLVDATDEPSVEDLMLASDLLVTDYSALLFDYVLLDRPIVVHADDWDAYRAGRGAYFDVTADPPGHVTRSAAELTDLLAAGPDAWNDAGTTRLRHAFRDRYCEFEDGRAAERVVRRVLLGEGDDTWPAAPAPASVTDGPIPLGADAPAKPAPDADGPEPDAPATSRPGPGNPAAAGGPGPDDPDLDGPQPGGPAPGAPGPDLPTADAPHTAAPPTDLPDTAAPPALDPGNAAPSALDPAAGAPAADVRDTGGPGPGGPQQGGPAPGEPGTGLPVAGDPGTGLPVAGDPVAGDPTASDPGAASPRVGGLGADVPDADVSEVGER